MTDPRVDIDDPDDEVLPASPVRRRARALLGCFTLLLLLALLTWFVATHTQTMENSGMFGP